MNRHITQTIRAAAAAGGNSDNRAITGYVRTSAQFNLCHLTSPFRKRDIGASERERPKRQCCRGVVQHLTPTLIPRPSPSNAPSTSSPSSSLPAIHLVYTL